MASAVGPRAQLLARGSLGGSSTVLTLPSRSPEAILHRIRLIGRTLEEHPGLTAPELADLVGYGRRHMSLLLLRLEEHGHVVHQGRRWFPGTRDDHGTGIDRPLRAGR
ncbi:MAG: hypothetical protein QOJ21_3469 [Solirubrobacteraceae bacterium]|nr:hypothetical protein [Solirubrobacteraceae bacterium]